MGVRACMQACVWAFVHACGCMRGCVDACVRVRVRACACVPCVHACVRMRACACVPCRAAPHRAVHMGVFAHMCACVVYTHIHTVHTEDCMCTYMSTCTLTQFCRAELLRSDPIFERMQRCECMRMERCKAARMLRRKAGTALEALKWLLHAGSTHADQNAMIRAL